MKFQIMCTSAFNTFPSFINDGGFCSEKAARKALDKFFSWRIHDLGECRYFIREHQDEIPNNVST